jgi:hypothetical protein
MWGGAEGVFFMNQQIEQLSSLDVMGIVKVGQDYVYHTSNGLVRGTDVVVGAVVPKMCSVCCVIGNRVYYVCRLEGGGE